jgi:outer membrane protein OmpA-like peptidoglycan-associated protein
MRSGGLFIAALLVGGCAGPSLLLLPDEEGGQGSVAVLESRGKAQETVVAQGNTRTRLGARPATRAVDPARLSAAERALLGDLPPPPKSFILYFQEGSTELTPQSRQALDSLRAEVARRPGVEVQVTGHTDTEGDGDDNDRLSQQRAEAIVEVLRGEGIARELMTPVGRGERQPLVKTGDNVAEPRNRRVEVIVR